MHSSDNRSAHSIGQPEPSVHPKPTDAELDVLQVLWRTGPASVRRVHEEIQSARPDTPYANVLRLMQVMHGKGVLTRDASEKSHVYAPAQSQSVTQKRMLRDMVHKVFAGSGKAMVLAALRGHVSPSERAEIEALLRGDDQ